MKKIVLLFTITCASQLYGMEAERIGDLPKKLQKEITQVAIASSKNIDDAINIIKCLNASFGIQYNKLFNNLKDFSAFVHILANAYDLATNKIAKKFKTEVANEYIKLGDELCHAEPQTAAQLIQMGADVNYINFLGNSLLHYAILFRHIDKVKILLDFGVNLYRKDKFGHTPHAYVVDLIKNYCNELRHSYSGFKNPFITFEGLKELEAVKIIIEKAMDKPQRIKALKIYTSTEMLPELKQEIMYKALETSKNLDDAIDLIKKFIILHRMEFNKIFNIKNFTKLAHALANKFNITTEEVAKKINIPIAQIYLTLGNELLT